VPVKVQEKVKDFEKSVRGVRKTEDGNPSA
jgi:hypothetical protein